MLGMRVKTTERSIYLSSVAEKCKMNTEKEPGQQRSEQAKRLGEAFEFQKMRESE